MPVLPKLMWKLQYLSDADFKEMNKPKTRGDNPFPETPGLVKSMNIGLVLRTVAHLRPAQVLFQVLRRVHKARFKALACPSVEVKPMVVEPAASGKAMTVGDLRFSTLRMSSAGGTTLRTGCCGHTTKIIWIGFASRG